MACRVRICRSSRTPRGRCRRRRRARKRCTYQTLCTTARILVQHHLLFHQHLPSLSSAPPIASLPPLRSDMATHWIREVGPGCGARVLLRSGAGGAYRARGDSILVGRALLIVVKLRATAIGAEKVSQSIVACARAGVTGRRTSSGVWSSIRFSRLSIRPAASAAAAHGRVTAAFCGRVQWRTVG